VNGTIVTSGTASASIPLGVGANPISVIVTAQDGTTQATYTVTIPISGYGAWQTLVFTNPVDLDDPARSGELATPAHDGITNLMKYALALEPMTCGTDRLPSAARQGGYLTLTYRKNKQATDVTYTVQVATSLTGDTWAPAAAVVSQTDQGDHWLVTVRDTLPYAGQALRFMRLRVNK
ncbi:MAG: cadherin-like beta sandwich domain-containing protein, partial [Verrucomicrobiota bacterium]